ncbi:MAG: terpene cyclase/mutase family protein [Planctomycetaceae bacterium]|nr:terpene cyclase/mutase family protein [Planctomycetaceae bacterium]
MRLPSAILPIAAVFVAGLPLVVRGAEPVSSRSADSRSIASATLTEIQWRQLDNSVDQALAYLITQQNRDGSFQTIETGQPGITSLCVLAFLSRGNVPGEGPYGDALNRAIDFVLNQQRNDGLLFGMPVGGWSHSNPAHTGIYNHAIAGLMLAEVYGMADPEREERIRIAVEQAVQFTLKHQSRFNRNAVEQGGWRYLKLADQRSDADLSITSWQLLFLRSARNAEFEVPERAIAEALSYVERCFDPRRGTFVYCIVSGRQVTPAMAGAGIVSLSMGGRHDSPPALRAAQWMEQLPFRSYGRVERYHYSAYYCSQAAFQLGGEHWARFYPPLMEALIQNQNRDGSWQREAQESQYGATYSTSLAVLALTPPYQILPIYQR